MWSARPGQRGERDDGLECRLRTLAPPVLRDVEEQVVRQPDRVEAPSRSASSAVSRTVAHVKRSLVDHRVVVLRKRQPEPHGATLRARRPRASSRPVPDEPDVAAALLGCGGARGSRERLRRSGSAAHRRHRRRRRAGPDRRAQRCRPPPDRLHRRGTRSGERPRLRRAGSPRSRSRTSTCGSTPACTRASVSSTSCRSSRCPRRPADVAVAAAHAFGAWLARVHRVPVFFYADAAPTPAPLPTVRRDAFTPALHPTSDRARPIRAWGDRRRSPPAAGRGQRRARDRRRHDRDAHRARDARTRRWAARRARARTPARVTPAPCR